MKMKYLLGSPKDFHDFVSSISKKDKIGIVTHTDVDGIASGIFLQKILESRGLRINFIEFINYGTGVLQPLIEKDFDVLFFTDWGPDNYPEDFKKLKKRGEILVFDHHPWNDDLKDKKGIIKTEGTYCSAHALFDLAKDYFDTKEWKWLVCAAIVLDYTFKNEEVFEFLKSVYPEITLDNIFESVPGENGKSIDSAKIYYKKDLKKIYDLVLKKDLIAFEKAKKVIDEEIEYAEKKYFKEEEYYSNQELHFGYFNTEHNLISSVISRISHKNPNEIFVMMADVVDKKEFIKLSARNQSGKFDLGKVLKKCTEGFENSTAGGHPKASAANFPKKYLIEFKKRLLKELS